MTDMKKPAQRRANPNNTSVAAQVHHSTTAHNAIAADEFDSSMGRHARACVTLPSRRAQRRHLKKQGLSPEAIAAHLRIMGYGEVRS